MKEYHRNNKSEDVNKALLYFIELFNQTNEKNYSTTVEAPKEMDGKKRAALQILKLIFTGNKKWLELVNEVSELVSSDRLKRGVGKKPELKKYDPTTGNVIEKTKSPKKKKKPSNINNPIVYPKSSSSKSKEGTRNDDE